MDRLATSRVTSMAYVIVKTKNADWIGANEEEKERARKALRLIISHSNRLLTTLERRDFAA